MAKWIEKEKNEGEMIVTFGGSKWANAKVAAMNVLKRAGKELSDDNITEAALNANLDDIFADSLKELNLTPATLPEIDIRAVTADSVTVCFTFALSPEVTMGDYSKLKYIVEDYTVSDEETEEGISVFMQRRAEEEAETKAREQAAKEQKAAGRTKTSNSGIILGGKEESPAGSGIVLTGDTRKPAAGKAGASGNNAAWESAPADSGMQDEKTDVKTTVKVPALTDDYVKSLKIQGVTTVDAFRTYIKNFLSKSKKLFNEQAAEEKLMADLLAVTQVEIPNRMVLSEISTMLQTLASSLAQQNITLKDYLEQNGESEEELVKELWPDAEKKVRTSLALEAVAKAENLYPSNSEVEGEYKAMALRYNMEIQELKQVMPANQVSYTLMLKKTMDYLKSLNQ